jgi:DNA-binding response OmpR family regulator
MAARVRETPEGFPRGWSNAAIINSAKKISSGPAMLCERCKTEIALANALDAEPDVNRRRRELLVGGERRQLPQAPWALFEALYAGRGQPLSGDFLRKVIAASGLGVHLHQLRRALAGSRYRIETHRGDGYELTIAQS